MKGLRRFLRDDQGQELIEYTFLIGFVVLSSLSLILGGGAGPDSFGGYYRQAERALPAMIAVPLIFCVLPWTVAMAYRWVLWASAPRA